MTGLRGRPAGRLAALAAAALLGAGIVAGCGGDDDGAEAPAASEVATVAPPEEPTVAEEPEAPPEAGATGDVAAGRQIFEEGECASCHPGAGTRAGVGPQLEGAGLSAGEIETTIVEGGDVMPGGLVSGQDLTDVVAYVESIQ